MVVETGDSCHSEYALVISLMANAKLATTIATQAALAALDLAVEMCTRPWMVEFSKNSRILAEAISLISVSQVAPSHDNFQDKLRILDGAAEEQGAENIKLPF